jgi:hypothetical protein
MAQNRQGQRWRHGLVKVDHVKLLLLQYLLHPPIDARREGNASRGAGEGNMSDGARNLDDLLGYFPNILGTGSNDADVVAQTPKFSVQIEDMFDYPAGIRIVVGRDQGYLHRFVHLNKGSAGFVVSSAERRKPAYGADLHPHSFS